LSSADQIRVEDVWSLSAQARLAVLLEDWDRLPQIEQEAEAAALPVWARAIFISSALVYRGRVSEAIAVSESAGPGAFSGSFEHGIVAAEMLLARGDIERGLERALLAREEATDIGTEMAAVAVAARARAALGRSAAVDALVQDHAAMAGRGAGAHEEREHLLLRGQLALAAGEPRQAITFLEDAADLLDAPLRCCTFHAATWLARGRAHLELDEARAAEEWFRMVGELGDARVLAAVEFVRSFYFLGKARAAGGNAAGAREAYQRFLSYWEDGDIDRERVAEARAYVDGA